MANKPQGKSWGEAQLTIAALAITATLGFWNLFSTPEKVQAGGQATQTPTLPPPPPPTETATPEPTASAFVLRPVKIIFGGKVPQQQVVQVAAPQPTTKKRKGGDNNTGGGGGGGSSSSAQPASTGSSKP